jgi:hypothetical protein
LLEELDDRWILGLRGSRIEAISRDMGLTMYLDTGAEITVSGSAVVSKGAIGSNTTAVYITDVSDEQLRRLVGASILSAIAFKSGTLRVVLSTGQHINTRSSDREVTAKVRQPGRFEWSHNFPNTSMIIYVPDK